MSVQLIPMSDNSGAPADAIGNFSNALQRSQQLQMQQQQHAAEMLLRQREADELSQQRQRAQAEHERQLRAAAIDEVMQHKDNPAMMHLTAQKYGIPLNTIMPDQQENIPLAGGPPSGGGAAAPGQSPMSMQQLMSIDPSSPSPDSPTPMTPGGANTVRVRDPITISAGTPSPTPEQEHLNYAHQLLTHDSAVAEQGDKVEQFQQAEQAAKNGAVPGQSSPVYELGFPGGPVRIDTGAIRAGEESNKAERLKKFDAALADNPEAQTLAKMMVHLGQPDDAIAKALVESGKIEQRYGGRLDLLERTLNSRSDLLDKTLGNRTDIEAQKEAARVALEKDQQAGGKYAGKTGVGPDGTNFKQEAANRMALNAFKSQTGKWAREYGLPQIARGVAGLDETEGMLKSGNPTASAAALERFVAVSRSGTGNGAAATNAALALFQRHLGGIGDTVEGAIEKLKSGDLGEEQKLHLLGAIRAAKGALRDSVAPLHQGYVDSYYNEEHQNIKRNAEDQEEAIFGSLGYHPQRDPNAKGVNILSGEAPSVRKPGGQAGGGIQKDNSAVTPQDQMMYQKAKAALADPGLDAETRASAQRVIDHINEKISGLR